ncbi:hypothetical protein PpBr36_01198 [Pyricularia pennisetigena]|uniref:hypothetical protein n=1 Tax=Pyricularia pennisetigena TaxID=1578925 RepID=UPI00114DB1B9|nr:hypothetical protein PpBr36_01198 [Pyricularia pennisetigena]TLS29825.1 hypothetical protein PpBr36_01198 [Pyricularia pennisetigena]
MATTLRSSNNINQRATDASKHGRMPTAADTPSLAHPGQSRAITPSNTMSLAQASSRPAVRSNSGSETNIDILPQHIRRGPHGSFEWDHGISPQRGPYKDDPHGYINDYFGPSEVMGSGATENHRASATSKPAGSLKNGPSPVHGPSPQIQVKADQQNALFKTNKEVFRGCEESSSSSNYCSVTGGAVEAEKESQDA